MSEDGLRTVTLAAPAAPRVSVVVPAFNSAWLIGDTILSLRHQTFREIEIIVVDDGSTDNLAEVLAPHIAADPRIRLIRQENRGLAGARNRGLAEARAGYVGFIDADDIWHPRFLQEMVAALDANSAAPFAFAYSFRFGLDNKVSGLPLWRRPPRHDFVGMLTLNVVGNGSAAVFRRDLLIEIGGFDEGMRDRNAWGAEDWKLCLRLSARGTPVLVPKPYVGYRFVADGMSQGDPVRQMRAVRSVMADIATEFPCVRRRHLADGKVTMNGWLLGAFLHKRLYGTALWMMVESYVLNPFWFANPSLRELHRMKLRVWYGSLTRSFPAPVPINKLRLDDTTPFAFLPVPVPPRTPPTFGAARPP